MMRPVIESTLFGEQAAPVCRASICWAMPSRWTFDIPPIHDFLKRHIAGLKVIVDPFAGRSQWGTHRNDLGHGGIEAADFCDRLIADGVVADAVLFDPPYSPRQIAECYKGIGRKATGKDTQNASLYARVRERLCKLLAPGGVALSFGWQSSGFGKAWPIIELLFVQHGGAHNDTICVAQVRREERTGVVMTDPETLIGTDFLLRIIAEIRAASGVGDKPMLTELAEAIRTKMTRTAHHGDCTIHASMDNGQPTDGICTCGYGFDFLRRHAGDVSHLYSEQRVASRYKGGAE